MKAKEVIYNLRTVLAPSKSELKNYSDQHVMFMLDEARAILASQKMDAKVNVLQMAQTIDIKPEKASRGEIGDIGDATVLRVDVPDPIAYMGGQGVFTVGPTDGQESFTPISYSQLRTALYRKYTAASPKWMWHENKMYIINADLSSQELIRVRAIFDRPLHVEQLRDTFNPLFPFDWEYPLSMKDLKTIYQLGMQGDLGWGDSAVQAINKANKDANKDNALLQALQNLQQPKQ